jgi:hypothetical protein
MSLSHLVVSRSEDSIIEQTDFLVQDWSERVYIAFAPPKLDFWGGRMPTGTGGRPVAKC